MKNTRYQTTVKTNVNPIGKMTVNPFTLKFNGECADLEASFYNYYLVKSLKQLRYAIVLGIFAWSLFAILDMYLDPANVKTLWIIRFGVIVPMMTASSIAPYLRIGFRNEPIKFHPSL